MGCQVLGAINLCFKVMRIMRQRFLWPDALPDADPLPLSRLGTGWGVPEGNSSGGVEMNNKYKNKKLCFFTNEE